MTSPICSQCDCVAGCSANLSLCPILVAECIASSQVSAAQHRVIDAPIAQPEQAVLDNALSNLLFQLDSLAGNGMIPWQIEDAFADYQAAINPTGGKTP